jgi:hypothetical protein
MSEQAKVSESTYVSVRFDDLNFIRNMAERANLAGVDKKQFAEVMDRVMTAQEAHLRGICKTCAGQGEVYLPANGYSDPSYAERCEDCGGTGNDARDAKPNLGGPRDAQLNLQEWMSRNRKEMYFRDARAQHQAFLEKDLAELFEAKGLVPVRCQTCSFGDVEISATCHNSGCTAYAKEVSLFQGWKQ